MTQIKRIKPKQNGTKVAFLCRLSFCHLDAPWSGSEGNEKKYSVSCIIPKEDTDTVNAVKAAIQKAYDEGVVKTWKGAKPPMKSTAFKYPLKDGDDERPDDAAYVGSLFFTASSKSPVTVLNRLREQIDPSQAYSGCYAVVSVNFFPFSVGSKGIGGGLNAVLKYADGEKLGGGGNAAADFDDMGIEEEDDLTNM